MDDPRDGPYSRAPELEDVVGLCAALNAAGARYVLIGGFAVILHGFVRGTKDIDLLVDASDENVRRLKVAMASLPDNAVAQIEDSDVRRYLVVRVADEVVVDLLGSACGIDYAGAIAGGIERKVVEGVEVPVASMSLLVRLKDTVRPSDAADVAFLRARMEEDARRHA
ncbi:MAG: hypothetical protein FJ087_08585 [Deltaproteobacteria bacterium]|nr:hypothetical protein [Deltaproteobacteria bacterium]